MNKLEPDDLTTRIAPLMLITAGFFSWAVRGSSGYGAVPGCIFAGTLWGITWYFLSQQTTTGKTRRYNLGWSVFAFIFGIGISGMQGWGDIVSMIRGNLMIRSNPSEFIPIAPAWGYFYMFLLGFHWAGIGALLLAYSGSQLPTTPKVWMGRIIALVVGLLVAWCFLELLPQIFLPNYNLLNAYNYDLYDKLPDLYDEIQGAVLFFGIIVGGLVYEIFRKDWINLKVILIPSLVTGIGWMFLITVWEIWVPEWAATQGISFNWWRCWESTSGGMIGLGFGIVFRKYNRLIPIETGDAIHSEVSILRKQNYSQYPNLEKLGGVYGGLLIGLIYSIASGIKGNVHIAYPSVPELDQQLLGWIFPIATIFFLIWGIFAINSIKKPQTPGIESNMLPNSLAIYLFVYWILRELGLQVTYALEYNFSERAFFTYYVILAGIDMIAIFWLHKSLHK